MRGRINNSVLLNNSWWIGLDCFHEKTSSCACLFLSGLKDIFHLYAHSEINCIYSKSLFISLAEILGSFTRKKREVSSAKSLTVEVVFCNRSLIYAMKNSGLKVDSCGTPADECPLSITCWNLVLVYRLIPHAIYTLSKAFEISRNTPRTSRVGSALNIVL